MELGERIRQARIGAGLSQRALCGEQITRNMLSQIENGTARPSIDTLQYLAARLNRPVSWFLQEDAVDSAGTACLRKALGLYEAGRWEEARTVLLTYAWGDALLDPMAALLLAQCALAIARQSPAEDAAAALKEAEEASGRTTLGGEGLQWALYWERCRQAGALLPPGDRLAPEERFLLARFCLDHEGAGTAAALLEEQTGWEARMLLGDAFQRMGAPSQAAGAYEQALASAGTEEEKAALYPRLEAAYLALEDYKNAYYYAKMQKK